ncbi:MAG TPA: hypothetical protein VI756_16500 [Blastocatellia bacterium]
MGDDLNNFPRDPRESLLFSPLGSQQGAPLTSPAGGPGAGRFKQVAPQEQASQGARGDSGPKRSFWDTLYHEAIKAGILTVVGPGGGLLIDYLLYRYERNADQVIEACQRAISVYVAGAIEEETGRALGGLLKGLLQGLILMMAVVAVTTLIGAGAGAAIGALCFGVGAAPGAAVGGEMGFDAGVWILEWLGIGFLAVYVAANLGQVVKLLSYGVRRAWSAGEHGSTREHDIDEGAKNIARSVAVLVRLILEAIVLYLLAKGSAAVTERLPGLLKALRESKLGKGFADWVETNYKQMISDPKLNPELRQSATAKGEEAPPEEPSNQKRKAPSGRRVVTRQEAEDILRQSGMSDARAKDFVRSFDDGPITVRTAQPGEQFYRYSGTPEGSGSFLTTQNFSSPDEAVNALHLQDYGNPATYQQTVTATEPTTVLEGGVRGGDPPGSPQTLVTDRSAFNYSTGAPY